MAVLARGPEDLILDGVLAKVEAWRVAQVAEGLALPTPIDVNFTLERDKKDAWFNVTTPKVVLELVDSTPTEKNGKIYQDGIAKYRAICITPTALEDEAGAVRYYYLMEQTRAALVARTGSVLTLSSWTCGSIRLGPFTKIEFEDQNIEQSIFAGAWEFSVPFGYTAASATERALTDLVVTAGRWSAAYHFT